MFCTSALAALTAVAGLARAMVMPQVDLGYEIHEATDYNDASQVYAFRNIRYGQAPVGDLRWKKPLAPTGRNSVVQNGSTEYVCAQSFPKWTAYSAAYTLLLSDKTPDQVVQAIGKASVATILNSTGYEAETQIETQTEDCLFLDVFASKSVVDRKCGTTGVGEHVAEGMKDGDDTGLLPVMVWIHGGGYVVGSKRKSGGMDNPDGLISRSRADGSEGIIVVSMNYRLGAFGFLAGPSAQAAGVDQNVGLHDQRLALQWVQDNIAKFGGDPNRVTISGLSAGGSSSMLQVAAYGGQAKPLFQQAWTISAGYIPISSQHAMENTTQAFLEGLGVTSIEDARKAPFDKLKAANFAQVGDAPYSSLFTYGPVVDGSLVPQNLAQSVSIGAFNHDVKMVMGHCTNEGPIFTDYNVTTDDEFSAYIKRIYPGAQDDAVNTIVKDLYAAPAGYDRAANWVGDFGLKCLDNYFARAKMNQTWNFDFTIGNASHSADGEYLFYNGGGKGSVGGPVIEQMAFMYQDLAINFYKHGDPNGVGLPAFPMQLDNAALNVFTETGLSQIRDPHVGRQCEWLQKNLFL